MNFNKKRKVESTCITAILEGDGTLEPSLVMRLLTADTVSRFVASSDLRTVGEKFISWADKRDKEAVKS